MLVVLPWCAKDEHLAVANLEMSLLWDGQVPHTCLLPIENGTDGTRIADLASRYFQKVIPMSYHREARTAYPHPTNSLWAACLPYVAQQNECWLWWEPDAVPLKPGWLSTLEAAYKQGGKPFMGVWVEARPDWRFPYMAGVGIYPANVKPYLMYAANRDKWCFDMALGVVIGPYVNHTPLIYHHWQEQSFRCEDDLLRIPAGAVLFHKCKDGSLPRLLTNQRRQDYPKLAEQPKKPESLVKTVAKYILPSRPRITVVYIATPQVPECFRTRFLDTYKKFPPGIKHDTIISCNAWNPTPAEQQEFQGIPNLTFYRHDNTGWDLGAYIAISRSIITDMIVCFGSTTYFKRQGWLRRMYQAWRKHGPGLYFAIASYEVTPHFSTTGFWCDPAMLAAYPFPVRDRVERYAFEHGKPMAFTHQPHPEPDGQRVFWKMVYATGKPVKLVTWDGEYDWWDWRRPPNIYRRGDQSNVLAYWHHCDRFDQQSTENKAIYSKSADTLKDQSFDLATHTIKNLKVNTPTPA